MSACAWVAAVGACLMGRDIPPLGGGAKRLSARAGGSGFADAADGGLQLRHGDGAWQHLVADDVGRRALDAEAVGELDVLVAQGVSAEAERAIAFRYSGHEGDVPSFRFDGEESEENFQESKKP